MALDSWPFGLCCLVKNNGYTPLSRPFEITQQRSVRGTIDGECRDSSLSHFSGFPKITALSPARHPNDIHSVMPDPILKTGFLFTFSFLLSGFRSLRRDEQSSIELNSGKSSRNPPRNPGANHPKLFLPELAKSRYPKNPFLFLLC